MNLLFLSQEDVISMGVLEPEKIIPLVKSAIVSHQKKEFFSKKSALTIDETLEWKFNSLSTIGKKYSSVKWLGSNIENRKEGLPRSNSLMILNDLKSGIPLAVMDSTYISAMRTGAYCSISAELLSKKSPASVGVLGAGAIARASINCLNHTLPDIDFNLFSIEGTERLITDLPEAKIVESDAKRAAESDIVVWATTTLKPIIEDDWIQSGSLHIGLNGYEAGESAIKLFDKIICDNWEHVKERNAQKIANMFHSGLLADSEIYGDIGEILLGKPGREADSEKILFNPVGLGELDHAVSVWLYETALLNKLGQKVKMRDNRSC